MNAPRRLNDLADLFSEGGGNLMMLLSTRPLSARASQSSEGSIRVRNRSELAQRSNCLLISLQPMNRTEVVDLASVL